MNTFLPNPSIHAISKQISGHVKKGKTVQGYKAEANQTSIFISEYKKK